MLKLLNRLFDQEILWLGILGLLIFIPLYPKFPLFRVPGTYVAIRLEDFVISLIFLLWFIYQARQGFKVFKLKTARLILLYFAVGFVSLLNALLITRTVILHLGFLHLVRRVEYMSMFFVTYSAVSRQKRIKSFINALIIAVIGVFVYGLGQKFLNWPVISTMNEEFSKGIALYLSEWTRINSTFAGHYDLAAFLILVLGLFFGFFVGVKKRYLKILSLILIVFSFYLLLLTSSRVSFVAYLITVCFVLVLAKRKILLLPVLSLSMLGLLLGSDLGERYAATFNLEDTFLVQVKESTKSKKEKKPTPTRVKKEPTPKPTTGEEKEPKKPKTGVKKKKKEKETGEKITFPEPEPAVIAAQRSGDIRFKVEWPRAIRAFLKNPLLGTGYSSVTLATDNDYLRALAETGILGLGSFLLIFLEIGKRFLFYIKKIRPGFKSSVVIGIAGGMFGFFANALFIDVFEASKIAFVFWMFAGLMMAIITNQKKFLRDENV